jgi:hypothetical protein
MGALLESTYTDDPEDTFRVSQLGRDSLAITEGDEEACDGGDGEEGEEGGGATVESVRSVGVGMMMVVVVVMIIRQ